MNILRCTTAFNMMSNVFLHLLMDLQEHLEEAMPFPDRPLPALLGGGSGRKR